MNYIEVNFNISVKGDNLWVIDIFKSELLSIGFESFVDQSSDFKGYVAEKDFCNIILTDYIKAFCSEYANVTNVVFETKIIEQKNWNQEWEREYESVVFGDFCVIRPPFNELASDVKYDIIIEPKMSFGTAHHPTTALMIMSLSKEENVSGKSLMDMGCGTAVLAILAKKIGFAYVEAVDNDSRAVENAKENAKTNNTEIEIRHLDQWNIQTETFDVFLANINRNTLLENMEVYCRSIKTNGRLILSGFYDEDSNKIIAAATACDLVFVGKHLDNKWTALTFYKK